jgi:hypothetical protein
LRACDLDQIGGLVQARGVYGLASEVWSVLLSENGRGNGLALNRRRRRAEQLLAAPRSCSAPSPVKLVSSGTQKAPQRS